MKPWEIVSEILKMLESETKVGAVLSELDKKTEDIILKNGGVSANKGYVGEKNWPTQVKPVEPFPTSLVVGVNSVIAHGHATDYALKEGDTVIYDVGVKKDGLCGDAALTLGVGEISKRNMYLLRYAKGALMAGLEEIKAGVSLAYIGGVIERYVARHGFVLNEIFAGHAIGAEMHEQPTILHYWTKDLETVFFQEGKMYCIEPIVTFQDKQGIRVNDWAWVTRDGKNVAMFEHQFLVEKDGIKILTTHI